MTVGDLRVEIVRKPIKNLHLGVYPPTGRVRVAAPPSVSDDAVRLAVVTRLAWIHRQQARFRTQARQSERDYVSGESHYFLGRRYRIRVIDGAIAGHVFIPNAHRIELHVRPGSDHATRERVFLAWCRRELRARAEPMLRMWAVELGVESPVLGIKRMKTKWGACNASDRRVWLNLELIKKPPQCLEYVIVHELAHLTERRHNERFTAVLDNALPTWRLAKQELNASPLADERWKK
jgi:hypothetical protein